MADRASTIRSLIAEQPSRSEGPSGFLQRVCRAVVRTLSASGAGISVLTDDGIRGVSAASDPLSEQMEELQFVLGEGPCIDAFDSRRPVLVPDLADGATSRWPMYGPVAQEGGVQAVFAFPLQIGAARLGVLDVFREHAGPLSREELTDALTVADITVAAFLDHQEANLAGECLADAVDHRAELFQAQGMVMVQIGGTISEAMVRMRAYAYAEGRALDDVARDVVASRLRFDRDHRGMS